MRARENTCPNLSVAIPVYNEQENLPELLQRLGEVLDSVPGGPHEMVFVDDGSSDATAGILERAAARDARIVVVTLSRNFGHQAAVSAALDHVRGEVVVVMDGDLQDSPEAIPDFIDAYRQGHDVVFAVRTARKESLWLRVCYALFYGVMRFMSDIPLPSQSGDFSLMSRRVVDQVRGARERNRYVRGLRTWVGFSQKAIEVERNARLAGKPKYTLWRLFDLALDGVFSFSVKPIRAATVAGMVSIVGGVLYSAYAVYAKVVLNESPQGFTTLILFVNFLAGTQLFFLGVIGEYIGRIYDEVKQRPLYIVQDVTGR